MRLERGVVFLGGALFGICLAAGFQTARAKGPSARGKAEVRLASSLCTQVAPSGKARMTPLAEGKEAFLARLELDPGAKVPEHRDATEEYIHVLHGHGTIYIEDAAHPVAPGTTVYMPAHAKVRFENGKESLVGLQVFAGPSPAKKYASWKGCH